MPNPKISTLTDDFRNFNATKWPAASNASCVGWRGRLTHPVTDFAKFDTSSNLYDATSDAIYFELATLPLLTSSLTALFLRKDGSNRVAIGRNAGNLVLSKTEAGVDTNGPTIAYDNTWHRWMRLRHDGTTLYWETSNNGLSWTSRWSTTTTVDLANVWVTIESGGGGLGYAEVTHLNIPPATASTHVSPPVYFGSLQTDTGHAAAEYAGGTRTAMQELSMASWNPTDGTFSGSYESAVLANRNTLQATGAKLTLSTGIHFAPSWLANLTNGKYVDQIGTVYSEPNMVFNQLVRNKVETYLSRINTVLGLNNYWAIRLVAGSSSGEVLYPGTGGLGKYVAYDANAQGTGTDRPSTVQPCPYPGWVPGNTSITIAQVGEWAEWYIRSLAECVSWQIRYLRTLGYTGWFEILTPGQGSRPWQYTSDIAARLNVASYTDVGAVWHKIYESLVDRSGVIVWCSSTGDQSGAPTDNVPVPSTDNAVAIDNSATVNPWSAPRWQMRLAYEYGMQIGGENPGYGGVGDTHYRDTTTSGMLAKAMAIAATGYFAFDWAHSARLWDTTMPFSNYQSYMSSVNGGSFPVPISPADLTSTGTTPPAPVVGAPIVATSRLHAYWRYAIGPWKSGASSKIRWAGLSGPQAEMVSAAARRLDARLLEPSTATFSVDGHDDTAAMLEDLITDLWIWRDGTPLFRGRLMSSSDEIDGVRHTTEVEFADYRGVLDRRLLYGDMTWTSIEQATIVWDMITDAQSRTGGNIGLLQNTYPSAWTATGVTRTVTFTAGDSIWESIKKLSIMDNGFDFDIDKDLLAYLYYPARGADNGVVLDVGGRVSKVTRKFDPAGYADALRQSGADGVTPTIKFVDGIDTAPEGRWDAQFGDTALNTTHMVTSAATGNLARVSRLIPTYELTLAPGAWRGKSHFWLGDWVTVVVKSGRLNEAIKARVYEMHVDIDDSDEETVGVTVGAARLDPRSVIRGIGKRVNQLMKR